MSKDKAGETGAPEGGDFGERIQDLGKRLVTTLHRSFKLSQQFERQNKAMERPVRDLLELNSDLGALDSRWELKQQKDHLHLCDIRLRAEGDLFLSYQYIL